MDGLSRRDTLNVIKAHRAAQLRERLARGEGWHYTGLVFTRDNGQMLKPAPVAIAFGATAM